eukprot:TRINITY_DN143_c0_g2_i3.p1 TRINITY_DN143_c0_g2~~TRINITY_DN143_c0_g2_i3.p1  ORF type:complete len:776 (-),score=85.06 TRINITY_DN143_c0_g2_i3:26-2044(-)
MSGHHIGNKTLLCKLSHGPSHSLSPPNDNLYIKPLLSTTSESDLRKLFEPFGPIRECKVMVDKNTGISRQIGFVRFESMEDARNALEKMNGHNLVDSDTGASHSLVIKFAESQPQKLSRRARLLANQSAAAARRYAAQLQQQQQQQQQLQAASPIVASSTTMLGDGPIEQNSKIVGVPADILIPPIVTMRRARGRGGSRGMGSGRRRRPRFSDRTREEVSNDGRDQEDENEAAQEPTDPVGFLPTPAGTRSFAEVTAGSLSTSKPSLKVATARSPSPPRNSPPTEAAEQAPAAPENPEGSHEELYQTDQPDTYTASTEEYPGYTATTTPEGVYNPDAAPFYSQYSATMPYYFQDQYGQYSYVPSADGTWYPDPNAAVYVPSPYPTNYVPLSALNPAGAGNQGYYSGGYQNVYQPTYRGRGGRFRGGKRGRGNGRDGNRGSRFGLPGFFQAHLPPFYGPQATSFPTNSSASSSLTQDGQLGGVASIEAHPQSNPLYPYPFVDPTNLFVFHLPIALDEKGLKKLFEQFGRVEGVRVARDKQSRKSKGYGFVKFRRMQDAIQAVMQMNGYTVENKHLKVAFKSAFSDRLPARRRSNRPRPPRQSSPSTEEIAAHGADGEVKENQNGFSDEPDSDEEAAFDKIIEQEDQREQEGEQDRLQVDQETKVPSTSAVAAH